MKVDPSRHDPPQSEDQAADGLVGGLRRGGSVAGTQRGRSNALAHPRVGSPGMLKSACHGELVGSVASAAGDWATLYHLA